MKEIKENLPLITVALLATGITWLISYYNYFGIEILNYIEFSEIFQLQFIIFFIVGVPIVAGAFYGLSFRGFMFTKTTFSSKRKYLSLMAPILKINWYRKFNNKIRPVNVFLNRKKEPDGKVFYGKPFLLIIIYMSICLALILISHELNENTEKQQLAKDLVGAGGILSLIMVIITGLYYTIKVDSLERAKLFIDKARLIIIYVAFSLAGIASNREAAYRIMHGKPKYNVQLLLKDKPLGYDTTVVTTNKLLTYVGQTKGYIFLYNRKSSQAHIIPKGQVLDYQINRVEYLKKD